MVFNLRTYSFASSVEGDSTPPKSFSLKELRVATHNFSRVKFLAYGDYHEVYRGRLADGSLVAVKRANLRTEEKFEAQVEVGSKVSTHPNVLCLRGFCRTKKELLLVYPLMINNCLSYHLRERSDRFACPLNWTTRKRIALGAARGLAHLHDQGDIKIMHRDFKTSNILLNGHFEAVIGGFSLALIMHERNVEQGTIEWSPPNRPSFTCFSVQSSKCSSSTIQEGSCPEMSSRSTAPRQVTGDSFLSPVGETSADSGSDSNSESCHRYEDVYISTNGVCGTLGFIAPEYFRTRKCTLKNDVFAYGAVLLELISGQLPSCMVDEVHLEDWTEKQVKEGQLGRVIDPNLEGNYMEDEALQLVRLALLCTQQDPSVRPKMSEVVRMLESQFFQRDLSTRSSCSQSECDSTPYHSFPPSPSPLGIAL